MTISAELPSPQLVTIDLDKANPEVMLCFFLLFRFSFHFTRAAVFPSLFVMLDWIDMGRSRSQTR